jgi:hypothetical protein
VSRVDELGSFDQDEWLTRRHKDREINENAIETSIVGWAVELHRDLGPGLLENPLFLLTCSPAMNRIGLVCGL